MRMADWSNGSAGDGCNESLKSKSAASDCPTQESDVCDSLNVALIARPTSLNLSNAIQSVHGVAATGCSSTHNCLKLRFDQQGPLPCLPVQALPSTSMSSSPSVFCRIDNDMQCTQWTSSSHVSTTFMPTQLSLVSKAMCPSYQHVPFAVAGSSSDVPSTLILTPTTPSQNASNFNCGPMNKCAGLLPGVALTPDSIRTSDLVLSTSMTPSHTPVTPSSNIQLISTASHMYIPGHTGSKSYSVSAPMIPGCQITSTIDQKNQSILSRLQCNMESSNFSSLSSNPTCLRQIDASTVRAPTEIYLPSAVQSIFEPMPKLYTNTNILEKETTIFTNLPYSFPAICSESRSNSCPLLNCLDRRENSSFPNLYRSPSVDAPIQSKYRSIFLQKDLVRIDDEPAEMVDECTSVKGDTNNLGKEDADGTSDCATSSVKLVPSKPGLSVNLWLTVPPSPPVGESGDETVYSYQGEETVCEQDTGLDSDSDEVEDVAANEPASDNAPVVLLEDDALLDEYEPVSDQEEAAVVELSDSDIDTDFAIAAAAAIAADVESQLSDEFADQSAIESDGGDTDELDMAGFFIAFKRNNAMHRQRGHDMPHHHSGNSDSDISQSADRWKCMECSQVNNRSFFRYCEKCWKMRRCWLPDPPKKRRKKRKSRPRQRKRLSNSESKSTLMPEETDKKSQCFGGGGDTGSVAADLQDPACSKQLRVCDLGHGNNAVAAEDYLAASGSVSKASTTSTLGVLAGIAGERTNYGAYFNNKLIVETDNLPINCADETPGCSKAGGMFRSFNLELKNSHNFTKNSKIPGSSQKLDLDSSKGQDAQFDVSSSSLDSSYEKARLVCSIQSIVSGIKVPKSLISTTVTSAASLNSASRVSQDSLMYDEVNQLDQLYTAPGTTTNLSTQGSTADTGVATSCARELLKCQHLLDRSNGMGSIAADENNKCTLKKTTSTASTVSVHNDDIVFDLEEKVNFCDNTFREEQTAALGRLLEANMLMNTKKHVDFIENAPYLQQALSVKSITAEPVSTDGFFQRNIHKNIDVDCISVTDSGLGNSQDLYQESSPECNGHSPNDHAEHSKNNSIAGISEKIIPSSYKRMPIENDTATRNKFEDYCLLTVEESMDGREPGKDLNDSKRGLKRKETYSSGSPRKKTCNSSMVKFLSEGLLLIDDSTDVATLPESHAVRIISSTILEFLCSEEGKNWLSTDVGRSWCSSTPVQSWFLSSLTNGFTSSTGGTTVRWGPGHNLCVLCEDRPKDAVIIHGKVSHQTTCYKCAKTLFGRKQRCPVCRRKILRIAKNIIC